MRLIDADALKAVKFHPLPYTHIVPTDADAESYKLGWNDAIDAIIDSAPTIDAVEVVRCKDCKWWNDYYRECESPNWNNGTDEYIVQPAGMFCGWGERRTDERSD